MKKIYSIFISFWQSEINCLFFFSLLLTIIKTIFVINRFVELERFLELSRQYSIDVDIEPSFGRREIIILFILIINSLILSFRKKYSIYISILLFTYIVIEYIRWGLWSFEVKESAGIEFSMFSKDSIFFLLGATWRHIFILILTICFIIWELKIIILALKSTKNEGSGINQTD